MEVNPLMMERIDLSIEQLRHHLDISNSHLEDQVFFAQTTMPLVMNPIQIANCCTDRFSNGCDSAAVDGGSWGV